MTAKISLKPSLLVGAAVSRSGGVTYVRREIDEQTSPAGALTKTWETTKHVANVDELKRAELLAGELRRLLRTVSYPTTFGLVCPKDREPDLDAITEQIKARVMDANAELTGCRLAATVVKGEIKSNDTEAANAIVKEIGGFLTELEAAIHSCDARKIRQTVAAVRGVETILPDVQSKVLKDAVAAARQAACLIVREAEKKGRSIEEVKEELDLSAVDLARAYFLEPDTGTVIDVDAMDPAAAERMAAVEA